MISCSQSEDVVNVGEEEVKKKKKKKEVKVGDKLLKFKLLLNNQKKLSNNLSQNSSSQQSLSSNTFLRMEDSDFKVVDGSSNNYMDSGGCGKTRTMFHFVVENVIKEDISKNSLRNWLESTLSGEEKKLDRLVIATPNRRADIDPDRPYNDLILVNEKCDIHIFLKFSVSL